MNELVHCNEQQDNLSIHTTLHCHAIDFVELLLTASALAAPNCMYKKFA